jgi:hypothetical protein
MGLKLLAVSFSCGTKGSSIRFHWEVNFTCTAHDWELESISTFLDLLYIAKVLGQDEDKICWKASTTKDFEVRLYYQALVPSVGYFP